MKTPGHSIYRFMLLTALAAVPPVILAVIFFAGIDPFKVARPYPAAAYFPDPQKYPARVSVNKGMATLAAFERNLQAGDTCNSFIFGSSISIYYDLDLWCGKLSNPEGVRAMHFDSASESIYSLGRKVDYLDSRVSDLRNALIVFDPIIMGNDDNYSPFAIDPPALHPGDLLFRLKYYYTFFRASTNADFFKNWLPHVIDGKVHDNARNPLFEPQPIVYDPVKNQEILPGFDTMIRTDSASYYSAYPLIDSPDAITVSAPVLTPGKLQALRGIASVFHRHHTDYKVIIGPNRRKVALNPADRDSLAMIFGGDRVYDFSMSHALDLEVDTLMYDNTHYRPVYSSKLLELAYP